MFIDGFVHQLPDIDPAETDGVARLARRGRSTVGGRARARYLLARLMERAREQGVGVPAMVTTDYINTIPPEQEPWFPGDEELERRIRAYIRWNAMAMVDRANHRFDGLGGHLSTFASAAALYDVGFNHFFRGKGDGGFGDQVFFQGHAAPGIYARAFLEGRLTEEQLDRFRREVDGGGLPSYPHPRRMPDVLGVPDRVDGPRPAQRGRTRRASTATCCTARSPTRARRRCGASSATARWTSPRRWPGCRSRRASSSTT